MPRSTYRLQFTADFGFADACRLVPYLARLGIGAVYASPLQAARQGSTHGYDVVDPDRLNPALGTDAEFTDLINTLHDHGMGLILDIVPNHMAAAPENRWWTNVLEHGPDSPHASTFDIDWYRGDTSPSGRAQVLLPILGNYFGEALEARQLRLDVQEGALILRYYDREFPVAPSSYGAVLRAAQAALPAAPTDRGPSRCLADLADLSERSDADAARAMHAGLGALLRDSPEAQQALEHAITVYNGAAGDPASFDALERLLDEQAYRLAHWRAAAERVNYRRFFDVSDLVSLRMGDPSVFAATHRLVLRLVEDGAVAGLRVDHVDGLENPGAYLELLRREVDGRRQRRGESGGYLVVEKILAEDETLPAGWPVSGTTGYDFLNVVNRLLVDRDGLTELRRIYAQATGLRESFDDVAYRSKIRVMEELFSGEVRALAGHLETLSQRDRYARNAGPDELHRALVEVSANLSCYRTYTHGATVSPEDRRRILGAVDATRRRSSDLSERVVGFVRRVLLLEMPRTADEELRADWLRFVQRWQQLTGPITAKGVEDTALYAYNALVSLNEVGGDPGLDVDPVAAFHRAGGARRARWPHAMSATATHDTKRGEDTRARIGVLSEIPHTWEATFRRWRRWNQRHRRLVGDVVAPDANEECLIYQTLLGAWPADRDDLERFRERLHGYLVKAARESKVHTSWIDPNGEYEQAVLEFVDAILEPVADNRFVTDFQRLQQGVAGAGVTKSLAQVLLKVSWPGIPDFYQGTELWDLSLADPDNRRPVDFAVRARLLDDLESLVKSPRPRDVRRLLDNWRDGRIKLYVTAASLAARDRRPGLFQDGDYVPLEADGSMSEHLVAFARRQGTAWSVTVTARRSTSPAHRGRPPLGRAVWRETTVSLPDDAPVNWRNVLTGERVAAVGPALRQLDVAVVLRVLPVALLEPV
ncbi:MAG TPA: malto-oligosyltrehalose synthase [Thermomicrobiaceae bacterium]|nr:malto-oligosyltrehalose synthase [Thermomicrobiaceae bacterium]